MKHAHFLFILIFVIATFFFYDRRDQSEVTNAIQSLSNKIPGFKSAAKSEQNVIEPSSDISFSTNATDELRNWIQEEASRMDYKEYDTLSTDQDLKVRAQKMGAEEISILKETALNQEAQSNERILSTYLLSMAGSVAVEALGEIAKSDLSKPGPHPAHSLDETLSMHEKAVKRMALDELFRRALADPSLKLILYQYIQDITVPELKAYGERRYQELFQ